MQFSATSVREVRVSGDAVHIGPRPDHSHGLHWFLLLVETGRVTATAAELGIAQPTLTRRLARLEQELGAALFERTPRRLVPTAAGRAFYERARRSQAELDAARREIADLATPMGTVRLAFLHSFGVRVVPALIRRFRETFPGAGFELRQDSAGTLARLVREGGTDLAITSPRPAGDGLQWQELFRQPLVLAVPERHPAAQRPAIAIGEVAAEPFIALQAGYGMRRILDELTGRAGFRPRITFESTDMATVVGLVGAGLGVGVVPAEQVTTPVGVRLVPLLDDGSFREVGMIRGDAVELPGPARAFAELVTAWAAGSRSG
ncbi:LysR family transcriptional regulator [Nakamurella alba]|nr:LysR family transcriptional regulator [Nakamurella alba]